jgi:hypothetical protein
MMVKKLWENFERSLREACIQMELGRSFNFLKMLEMRNADEVELRREGLEVEVSEDSMFYFGEV